MFDGEAFGQQMVEIVRGYVDAELAPLRAENEALAARVKELEARPAPEKGDPGEPGQDATAPSLEAVWSEMRPRAEEIIAEAVSRAVEALPKPKDGDPGKDAANIVEALKDSGELVLTLQDGRLIRTGIRDGEKGQDGRDGFGFDDMDACVLDDDRTIELSFRRGEEEKCFTFKWPIPVDRGVYKAGETYEHGDAVTWGGSLWIAQRKTDAKPDTPDSGWRLAVKKGRDGKDAKNG